MEVLAVVAVLIFAVKRRQEKLTGAFKSPSTGRVTQQYMVKNTEYLRVSP